MKILKPVLCSLLVVFLAFTPARLVSGARASFVDTRFVRSTERYNGTIVLYHVVRERPYVGSLSNWLAMRAEAYEKKHKGTYFLVEAMDEAEFMERIERGRPADAYSFFSGSLWEDRLAELPDFRIPFRQGIFQTGKAIPYAYSGFVRLVKSSDRSGENVYTNHPVLAARAGAVQTVQSEEKAETLYLDLRRAGDLIRYRDAFSSAKMFPVDNVTEAVCWLGIDRNAEEKKKEVILDFMQYLLEPDVQPLLNALGMMSVRRDVRNEPPDASLKAVFRTYETVVTFDPFRWQLEYDSLYEDAVLALKGDSDAGTRFTIRLQELYR